MKVDGEESKAVFTTVDLPKRLAFMVEAIGEFDFQLALAADTVNIKLKVSRALAPGSEAEWVESVQKHLSAFEAAMKNG